MGVYSWLQLILEQETEPMTDKQKSVIKAAVELFSEKGYAATSTREIAQKAGVAEGTIFKQYPTKKDLMLWIIERLIRTAWLPFLTSGFSELLAKPYNNRAEFLSAFLQNRMGLMQEGIPLFKIILQEIPFQPEIRTMVSKEFQKLPFAEIVEKLNGGEKSDYTVEDTVQILLSCIVGFFVLRNVMLPELFPENKMQNDAATFLRFINRGLDTGHNILEKETEGERL